MPAVVLRSPVTDGRRYAAFREILRWDFWFSCAYCSLSEAEAAGIGFEIDHFLPQKHAGTDEYVNLMWACRTCNGTKLATWPTPEQLAKGFRFVRPDEENPADHYELDGVQVRGTTQAGRYSEAVLDLNRKLLRQIREIRSRIYESSRQVLAGLQALEHARVDKIAPEKRQSYLESKDRIKAQWGLLLEECEDAIDVRAINRSELIDPDPDRVKRRRAYLQSLRVLEVGDSRAVVD
jgi:hypothetical protein